MRHAILIALSLIASTYGATIKNGLSGRIFGGHPAEPNEYPWQATVTTTYADGSELFCGGSLIAEDWILTSANCVIGGLSYTIGLGSNNKSSSALQFTTDEAILHEGYESLLTNNIAVIKLPSRVILGENIQLISLPLRSQETLSLQNQRAFVSGFGFTANEDGNTVNEELSETLNSVEKLIITNVRCEQLYMFLRIPVSALCAEGWIRVWFGVCNGDTGGPLVWNDGGVWRQVGIVSMPDCRNGLPAVYARVSRFLDWISSKTGIEIM